VPCLSAKATPPQVQTRLAAEEANYSKVEPHTVESEQGNGLEMG